MIKPKIVAPPLDVSAWLNTAKPISLAELKGKVVVIHAFQMLCPGCVTHGIPQASTIDEIFRQQEVQVIGLHTVFEHHDVMTKKALSAFIHEYRISFPIAIDRPSASGAIPNSMANYQMQGTPTLIIIDKNGYIRLNHFGRMSDMQVGSIIGGLLAEKTGSIKLDEKADSTKPLLSKTCGEDGCSL